MGENTYLTTDFYVKGHVLSHERLRWATQVVALANAIWSHKGDNISVALGAIHRMKCLFYPYKKTCFDPL